VGEDAAEDSSGDQVVLGERTPEERAEARAARERRRQRRRRHERRRRRRRIAITLLAVLVLLVAAGFVWFRYTVGGLDRIPGALPGGSDTPGTTILLVASDPGAHDEVASGATWRQDLRHSDLVMLVHLPANREAIYAISVPGTTQLRLPGHPGTLGETEGGSPGDSAASTTKGSTGYVLALERATGVQVDRLAVLDLNAMREIVDELDGVTAQVPGDGCGVQAGPRRLDGQGALELIRLRPCLPQGDLDRVARQQAVFRALLAQLVEGGPLLNPFRLNRVAKSTFDHLAVNEGWGLWDMAKIAWSLRGTTPRTTTFLTAPTRTAKDGTITLDPARSPELWQAVRDDRVDEYVALNRDAVAGR
jgi:LCP family protein required for cell wall assembly